MIQNRFDIFDGDGHIVENYDEMWPLFEESEGAGKDRNTARMYDVFPSLDGWPRGVYLDRRSERKYAGTSAEIWDEMLNDLGAQGSVLYPTAGLGLGLIQDPDWSASISTAYNNWLETYYTGRDDRLYGAGVMAIEKPEAAIAEMRRCAENRKNFVVMMLPSVLKSGRKYGDKFFWPIYAEAQRLGMPLAVHGGATYGHAHDSFDRIEKVRILHHPVPLFMHLTDIIFSGVFDEFPDLRIAFLEAGCGWAPWLMDKMDHEFDEVFNFEVGTRLKRKPSEYFTEGDNFWVGLELDEKHLKYAIDEIGSGKMIYASDYPHEIPPPEIAGELQHFIDRPDIADAVKANILCNNAKRFYRLD